MNQLRYLIPVVCVLVSCFASAGEQVADPAECVASQTNTADLQPLQGTWEGTMVGDPANQKITVTISGRSLRFHRDEDFWFETTITLPAGKNPKQLHATIKSCPPAQADSIGQVVRAFFKIEDEMLTLATMGDDTEETPEAFDASGTRYELRKVQPAGVIIPDVSGA